MLYLLTGENQGRPVKTCAKLAAELAKLVNVEKLELVLEIIVRSGLVVLFPKIPERYQLIHNHLVDLICSLQQVNLNLQTQLKWLQRHVKNRQVEGQT